jgi:hypothetical protein
MASWWPEFSSQLLSTVIGAFAGAYAAFAIDHLKERAKEYRQRAAAVNLATHWLSQMYSALRQYRDEILNPSRGSPALWYTLPPCDLHTGPAPTFDYPSLQFLFASRDPSVVSELAIEETRFRSLVELVRRRSSMHHEEMQALQERSGLRGQANVKEIEAAVGPRIVQSLNDYTAAIVIGVDRGVETTLAIANSLRAAALPLVGTETLLRFVPKEPVGTDASSISNKNEEITVGSSVEIRAGIDTETVRGLQLMNGGLAAALGAMLPNLIQTPELRNLTSWVVVSMAFAALGLVASVVHNRLRRKCSLQYDLTETSRQPRCDSSLLRRFETVRGEPCVCTWSIMWMWTSVGLFVLALAATVAGAATTAGREIQPRTACWDMKDMAGKTFRVNTCTGRIEAYPPPPATTQGATKQPAP